MSDRRILTITARAGDPLPARSADDTERTYDARVLRWAVPALTEEEAARVIALVSDGIPRLVPAGRGWGKTFAGARALLLLAFPDAEVRRG